jgi:hypothetical protein
MPLKLGWREYTKWRYPCWYGNDPAIVVGREALQQGLIKCIGSGFTLDVWNDKWIPGIRSMQPTVQLGEAEDHDEIALVSDLIDNEIGCWRIDNVRSNFITPKADGILNTEELISG